jgi:hypothetical protein
MGEASRSARTGSRPAPPILILFEGESYFAVRCRNCNLRFVFLRDGGNKRSTSRIGARSSLRVGCYMPLAYSGGSICGSNRGSHRVVVRRTTRNYSAGCRGPKMKVVASSSFMAEPSV